MKSTIFFYNSGEFGTFMREISVDCGTYYCVILDGKERVRESNVNALD